MTYLPIQYVPTLAARFVTFRDSPIASASATRAAAAAISSVMTRSGGTSWLIDARLLPSGTLRPLTTVQGFKPYLFQSGFATRALFSFDDSARALFTILRAACRSCAVALLSSGVTLCCAMLRGSGLMVSGKPLGSVVLRLALATSSSAPSSRSQRYGRSVRGMGIV